METELVIGMWLNGRGYSGIPNAKRACLRGSTEQRWVSYKADYAKLS